LSPQDIRRDRLRLDQGRLGLVLHELRRVCGGHPRLRCFGEVRNCQERDASLLALKTQRLPDCDQTRWRAVDAAKDPFEDLGLARLGVHPHGLGRRSDVDPGAKPLDLIGRPAGIAGHAFVGKPLIDRFRIHPDVLVGARLKANEIALTSSDRKSGGMSRSNPGPA
jgi:hypothetical protein